MRGKNGMRSIMGLGVTVLLGCGGGSGSFMTSVPAGTKLTDLTSSQQMQLCNDFESYSANTLGPKLCRIQAFETAVGLLSGQPASTDDQLQAACTEAYTACLSPDGGASGSGDSCTGSSDISSTCTATVGDIESCFDTESSQLDATIAVIPSCSTITSSNILTASAKVDQQSTETTQPASCTQVEACDDGLSSAAIFPPVGTLVARIHHL